jgi:formamidopyrimidine-DNA glycosylase
VPELPEVELVANALGRAVRGLRFEAAKLIRPGLAPDTTPREFARRLRGACVVEVGRRGKHILASLDNGETLITHLRMTGSFRLVGPREPLPKHTHALFRLEDGRSLAFTDQRHFGLMRVARASELREVKELRGLAPEPFSEEFSDEYLASVLARSRRTLKDVLLDQTKVTGLGNIYAAEALFVARAHPFVHASKFSRRRVARLRRAIVGVLGEAVAHGAARNVSLEDLESSYYGGGEARRWRVYDREGEPCAECRAPISRISHAGRSTYFCPRCQRR